MESGDEAVPGEAGAAGSCRRGVRRAVGVVGGGDVPRDLRCLADSGTGGPAQEGDGARQQQAHSLPEGVGDSESGRGALRDQPGVAQGDGASRAAAGPDGRVCGGDGGEGGVARGAAGQGMARPAVGHGDGRGDGAGGAGDDGGDGLPAPGGVPDLVDAVRHRAAVGGGAGLLPVRGAVVAVSGSARAAARQLRADAVLRALDAVVVGDRGCGEQHGGGDRDTARGGGDLRFGRRGLSWLVGRRGGRGAVDPAGAGAPGGGDVRHLAGDRRGYGAGSEEAGR